MGPSIDLMGGVRLPGVEDRPERVALERRHDDVHVIRHHAPGVQAVSHQTKEKKSLLDDSSTSGERQHGVARLARRLRELSDIFGFSRREIVGAVLCGSAGIEEAEGHEVRGAVFLQVRKFST